MTTSYRINDELPAVEPDDDEFSLVFPVASEAAALARILNPDTRNGSIIARKIARANGTISEELSQSISCLVAEHIRGGGKLHALIEAANAAFNSNKTRYYLATDTDSKNGLALFTGRRIVRIRLTLA